jgi:hypothetical protein
MNASMFSIWPISTNYNIKARSNKYPGRQEKSWAKTNKKYHDMQVFLQPYKQENTSFYPSLIQGLARTESLLTTAIVIAGFNYLHYTPVF